MIVVSLESIKSLLNYLARFGGPDVGNLLPVPNTKIPPYGRDKCWARPPSKDAVRRRARPAPGGSPHPCMFCFQGRAKDKL